MKKCCTGMWNSKPLPMDEVLKGCLNPYFNEVNNKNENDYEISNAVKKSLNISTGATKTAKSKDIKCERCCTPKNG